MKPDLPKPVLGILEHVSRHLQLEHKAGESLARRHGGGVESHLGKVADEAEDSGSDGVLDAGVGARCELRDEIRRAEAGHDVEVRVVLQAAV